MILLRLALAGTDMRKGAYWMRIFVFERLDPWGGGAVDENTR